MILRQTRLMACAAILAALLTPAARAADDNYSIMTPEPWLAPKYRSPRGLPQKPRAAVPRPVTPPSVTIVRPEPPTILPDGRSVPNLPPVSQGMVPGGGAETFGDRAARCAHQLGLYGVPNDQRSVYMHSCTMQ